MFTLIQILTILAFKRSIVMVFDENILRKWQEAGKKVALARVVKTWRSSPRPTGSILLINEDGEMSGSVSGGCVENAVVTKAIEVLQTGKPTLAEFGVADEDAWEVGLSCGGALSVYIEPFFNHQDWDIISTCKVQNRGLIILTQLDASGVHFFVDPNIENGHSEEVNEQMLALYLKDQNAMIEKDGISYFCHVMPPKRQMILIGSAHITTEMISLAKRFGFETLVIDPRDTFAKKTSYTEPPDQIYVKWPQEVLPDFRLDQNTYAVILSHDPKIDDEALKILLKSKVRYIGALGSKRTQARRVERLKAYGFDEETIDRLHAPIGIDIHSLLPNEIALSIMAEIIKIKNSPN